MVDWKARERARFEDNTYTKLPWHNEPWFNGPLQSEHLAHVALIVPKEPQLVVAFTASADHGKRDVQTVMYASSYLKCFYPEVNIKEALGCG